ncbi:hypothetical protein J2790_004270 [Paenarthrobacter nicotinovorans]|uniref:hypothetical protein n=1 Tax=Micrococcaceae TaxID=1268 RepID=UPI000876C713|nr:MULTISPECIES: hypothetical protein [Micrococcaceae]MDR6439095.1 hypothetical protein [Paenarthrobacter nicotinovorans]SCZ65351.1 hypothetical protein SAMN02799638_04159 [Arthrobacter sp. UNCCL28]
MQFKRSAGLFLTGFWLSIGGTVVGWLGAMTAISSSNSYFSSGPDAGSVFAMLLGGAAGVAGFICLAVAAHRALYKIDALYVPVKMDGVYVPAPQQYAQNQSPYPYPPGQNYQG